MLISKLPRRQEEGRTEPPTTMSSSGAALKLLLLCALASSVRSQSLDLPIRVIQKDVNSADEMKAMGSQQEAECGDLPKESDAGQYVKNLSTDTCAEKVQRKFKKTKRDVYLVHASLPCGFFYLAAGSSHSVRVPAVPSRAELLPPVPRHRAQSHAQRMAGGLRGMHWRHLGAEHAGDRLKRRKTEGCFLVYNIPVHATTDRHRRFFLDPSNLLQKRCAAYAAKKSRFL